MGFYKDDGKENESQCIIWGYIGGWLYDWGFRNRDQGSGA